VVIPPFTFPALPLLHRDNMPNTSTPPHSQDASDGRFSSKPTPLKHDRLGSQAHSSGTPPKASILYKEMTRNACDKFVGPMPVNEFLLEFVPEAAGKRPADGINFSDTSVSQKEESFVSHCFPRGVNAHEYYRSAQWNHLVFAPSSNLKIPLLSKIVQKRSRNLTSPFIGKNDDIFRMLTELKRDDEEDGDLESHIRWTNSAYKICGQLIAYATALHHSQFRVFSFGFVLYGEKGRLLR